jgi:hypothetical protein
MCGTEVPGILCVAVLWSLSKEVTFDLKLLVKRNSFRVVVQLTEKQPYRDIKNGFRNVQHTSCYLPLDKLKTFHYSRKVVTQEICHCLTTAFIQVGKTTVKKLTPSIYRV